MFSFFFTNPHIKIFFEKIVNRNSISIFICIFINIWKFFISLFNSIFSNFNSFFMIIDNFIIENGKVKSLSKSNRIKNWKTFSNFSSLFISFKSIIRYLFFKISFSIFSNISIIISFHFNIEYFSFIIFSFFK